MWAATEALTAGLAADLAEQLRCDLLGAREGSLCRLHAPVAFAWQCLTLLYLHIVVI